MKWKEIKGYDGYEVSEYGDVKSLESKQLRNLKQGLVEITLKEKILSPSKITKSNRYKTININGRVAIHKLVYETFIGDIPNGLVINHIDLDRNNNHYSNFEVVKQIENVNHYWNDYFDDKITNTHKLCSKCKNMLPFASFYIKPKAEINEYKPSIRHYRSACKKCMDKKL
jgi:hypothetical protein